MSLYQSICIKEDERKARDECKNTVIEQNQIRRVLMGGNVKLDVENKSSNTSKKKNSETKSKNSQKKSEEVKTHNIHVVEVEPDVRMEEIKKFWKESKHVGPIKKTRHGKHLPDFPDEYYFSELKEIEDEEDDFVEYDDSNYESLMNYGYLTNLNFSSLDLTEDISDDKLDNKDKDSKGKNKKNENKNKPEKKSFFKKFQDTNFI
ncbi:hypothetical protein PGO_060070 [Plasmodium gonderi]|uniref:Uncharacterized protein n=1 Tax=Plasmodium gonderi TaxID=77519 RepID=A0A1Y1JHF3_PLAGO|nr:hypothetical protein PGO_060070 [Plasmodium gonderi]GAW79863.1 hypothetical protein PGO_060070 [Plasmodium gonderi]